MDVDLELDFDCDCAFTSSVQCSNMFPLPVIYSLELTPLCNNRCEGCGNVFASQAHPPTLSHIPRPMDAAQWNVVLEHIAPYAQRVRLTGGEPSCHPQFHAIVERIRTLGISFTLFTNGRWSEPDRFVTFLRAIPECVGMLVSLHGATPHTHDAFSGVPGSFDETVANIRRAAQAGLTVHTNTVLTRHNHRQVADIVNLSHSLGAACAVFNRYIGKPVAHLELEPDDFRHAIHEVDRVGKSGRCTRLGTCIPSCFTESSSTACLAGTGYCTIDPWGYVRPCNHAPTVAGNVQHEPLSAIWTSLPMEAWRAMIPAACRQCEMFDPCRGGCRAEAVLNGCAGDPLMGSG
jgi:radical SAM protein with 4Fe4S-binding SPASM domain